MRMPGFTASVFMYQPAGRYGAAPASAAARAGLLHPAQWPLPSLREEPSINTIYSGFPHRCPPGYVYKVSYVVRTCIWGRDGEVCTYREVFSCQRA
jgi:hypothetical protein